MTAWHWEGLSTWAQSGGEDKGADLHGRHAPQPDGEIGPRPSRCPHLRVGGGLFAGVLLP